MSAQKLACANKLANGSGTTDVPMESCLLNGEVAEAFGAWRQGRPNVAEELEAAVAKLAKNRARACRRLPSGVMVKAATAACPG